MGCVGFGVGALFVILCIWVHVFASVWVFGGRGGGNLNFEDEGFGALCVGFRISGFGNRLQDASRDCILSPNAKAFTLLAPHIGFRVEGV